MTSTSNDTAPDRQDTAGHAEPGAAEVGGSADRLSWLDGRELCAQTDPYLFMPEEPSPDEPDRMNATAQFFAARRICNRCPLQRDCLAFALDSGDLGVWGGTGERWREWARQRLQRGEVTREGLLEVVVDRGRYERRLVA